MAFTKMQWKRKYADLVTKVQVRIKTPKNTLDTSVHVNIRNSQFTLSTNVNVSIRNA